MILCEEFAYTRMLRESSGYSLLMFFSDAMVNPCRDGFAQSESGLNAV